MTTKAVLQKQLTDEEALNRSLREEVEQLKARVPTSREEVAKMTKDELDEHYNWYHRHASCNCQCGGDNR